MFTSITRKHLSLSVKSVVRKIQDVYVLISIKKKKYAQLSVRIREISGK